MGLSRDSWRHVWIWKPSPSLLVGVECVLAGIAVLWSIVSSESHAAGCVAGIQEQLVMIEGEAWVLYLKVPAFSIWGYEHRHVLYQRKTFLAWQVLCMWKVGACLFSYIFIFYTKLRWFQFETAIADNFFLR